MPEIWKTSLRISPSIILFSLGSAAFAQPQTLSPTQALEQALLNRPAMQAAQLAITSAQRSAAAISAYPATSFFVGYSSRDDLGATDQDFSLVQPVDVFGRTSARRQVGFAAVQRARAEAFQVELSVQHEVLEKYFEAVATVRLRQTADGLLTVAESLRAATIQRFEAGRIPEIQVTRTGLEYERAKQVAATRAAKERSALTRLAAAIGAPGGSITVEVGSEVPLVERNDLSQRPDMRLLASEVLAAEARGTVARREGLPELELVALRSPWRGGGSEYGGRIQLMWSVFDHGRAQNESRAETITADSVRQQMADIRLQAEAELSAIEIEIVAASETVTSYTVLQGQARILVSKAQQGFTEGVGTLIEVLEATRALREIEEELAEAQLRLDQNEIAILLVTGTRVGGAR